MPFRVDLIFAPSSFPVKHEQRELYQVPRKGSASTVQEVIEDICDIYHTEPWFPSTVKSSDIELFRDGSGALAHISRRQVATIFDSQGGPEMVLRVCAKSARRPVGSGQQPATKLCCGPCQSQRPKADFNAKTYRRVAPWCKACNKAKLDSEAAQRAASKSGRQHVSRQLQSHDTGGPVSDQPSSQSVTTVGAADHSPESEVVGRRQLQVTEANGKESCAAMDAGGEGSSTSRDPRGSWLDNHDTY